MNPAMSNQVVVVEHGAAHLFNADDRGRVDQFAQVTVPVNFSAARAAVLALSIAALTAPEPGDMVVVQNRRTKGLAALVAPPAALSADSGDKPDNAQTVTVDQVMAWLATRGDEQFTAQDVAAHFRRALNTLARARSRIDVMVDCGAVQRLAPGVYRVVDPAKLADHRTRKYTTRVDPGSPSQRDVLAHMRQVGGSFTARDLLDQMPALGSIKTASNRLIGLFYGQRHEIERVAPGRFSVR